MIIRTFFLLSFILLFPHYLFGQSTISFDANGRWANSFKAEHFPKDLNYNESIPIPGVFFYSSTWTTPECGDNQSGVYAYANHAAGEGDRAFRYAVADGINNNSTPLTIIFPRTKEFWIRFYIKWEEGFRWEYLNYQKILGFFGKEMYQLLNIQWENRYFFPYSRINADPIWVGADDRGWKYMFGSPLPGESNPYSDGSWQYVEMYAKMNSAVGVYDGEAGLWLNGELVAKETAVKWDTGNQDSIDGFHRVSLGLNQREPGNSSGPLGRSCSYTYFDDIIIYNQTPPNTDTHGNPFIGPIWGDGRTSPPMAPHGLRIKTQ